MTEKVCVALGEAVVRLLSETRGPSTSDRPLVVSIGRDTRESGDRFEKALAWGVMRVGADVRILGVIPTPAVAHLTRSIHADAGFVISASHNPYQDNGIKIFGSDGFKLSDDLEAEIERTLLQSTGPPSRPYVPDRVGQSQLVPDAIDRYGRFLMATLPPGLRLSGLRVALDCAHGAGYEVGPKVMEALGATTVVTGAHPDGRNINRDCGALHPQTVADLVREQGADLGIALDGDADRVVLIDEHGRVVDGDDILALIATTWKKQGKLAKDTVVATIMSNIGLEIALKEQGIELVRTGVGDRYVVERMRRDQLNLGGEPSGHIICLDRATTGDGLIAALLVTSEMVRTEQPLSRLGRMVNHFPQRQVDVQVSRKPPLEDLPDLVATIKAAEQALGHRGRVVVRYSGTESKARVMVEGEEPQQVDHWTDEIAEVLREAVGEGPP